MSSLQEFLSLHTPKFKAIKRAVGDRPVRLLDVGCGNHSPSKIKKLFPQSEYYGIDLDRSSYAYDEEDNKAMTAFYEMDLTKLEFDAVPDDYFDMILMAHIIEHLHNGDEVIARLSGKLKKGGYIYIEYPSERSKKLPSMHGSLNFHDDKTHVRVYSVPELKTLLQGLNFTVINGGTRREWTYILAMPARIIGHWIKGKKLVGNIFWDLLGFAEYVFAQKN